MAFRHVPPGDTAYAYAFVYSNGPMTLSYTMDGQRRSAEFGYNSEVPFGDANRVFVRSGDEIEISWTPPLFAYLTVIPVRRLMGESYNAWPNYVIHPRFVDEKREKD